MFKTKSWRDVYMVDIVVSFFVNSYFYFLFFLQNITLITQVQSYTTKKMQNRKKNTTKVIIKDREFTFKPDPGSSNMLMYALVSPNGLGTQNQLEKMD